MTFGMNNYVGDYAEIYSACLGLGGRQKEHGHKVTQNTQNARAFVADCAYTEKTMFSLPS